MIEYEIREFEGNEYLVKIQDGVEYHIPKDTSNRDYVIYLESLNDNSEAE
jgi:hypothetical protein